LAEHQRSLQRAHAPPRNDDEARALDRPVFVVGLNKSGTSLLYLLLSNHPELSPIRAFKPSRAGKGRRAMLRLEDYGIGEGQKIPGLLPALRPGERVYQFGAPASSPHHRLTEEHVQPDDRVRLTASYRGAMVDASCRLCEKSPPNLIRTRFLQAVFPDACFVAITRGPFATVAANAKRHTKWGTVAEQARHWAGAYACFLEDRRYLRKCLVISYESLVADVTPLMAAVFQHCEVDPAARGRGPVPAISGADDADLEQQLTPSDRATIANICGPTMKALGY
jgi:hypothetical protein